MPVHGEGDEAGMGPQGNGLARRNHFLALNQKGGAGGIGVSVQGGPLKQGLLLRREGGQMGQQLGIHGQPSLYGLIKRL